MGHSRKDPYLPHGGNFCHPGWGRKNFQDVQREGRHLDVLSKGLHFRHICWMSKEGERGCMDLFWNITQWKNNANYAGNP